MIYFDNAATTFPKPPSVVSEVVKCMNEYCGNPGRSGHGLSIKAAEKIYECRELISKLFGVENPTNVVLTPNTTYALNIAINAFAKKKGHIIISDIEHNSVYRVVHNLSRQGIDYDIFSVDANDDTKTLRSFRSKIKYNTNLVVCSHVSNICGITTPIKEIGKICKQYGIKFIELEYDKYYAPEFVDKATSLFLEFTVPLFAAWFVCSVTFTPCFSLSSS